MDALIEQRTGKAEALPELTEVPVVSCLDWLALDIGAGLLCSGTGGRGAAGCTHHLSSALARLRHCQS